jgi:hypothetical protein
MREKTDSQQWQLKCRAYQQRAEQLQKNYQLTKEKYKQRLHEERFVIYLKGFLFILFLIFQRNIRTYET